MLRTLATLLDKAAAHALDKKLDFAELAQARLAADMYPLSTHRSWRRAGAGGSSA